MVRRDFIKVMVAGGCYCVAPAILGSCSSNNQSELKPVATDLDDIRLTLVSHAMLAPNSHNVQPWLVKLKDSDTLELYVDRQRLLPETDPPARQIHISQGTFLEALQIAGAEFGYKADISYFPEGMYSNLEIKNRPVASIRLAADAHVQKSAFFPLLRKRQSNKRHYTDKSLPDSHLAQIEKLGSASGFKTTVSASPEAKQKLAPLLGEAMAIETSDVARNRETVDIFRFNEQEAERTGDGFTIANNGVTGFKRFIAESFFLDSREKAYAIDSSFAKEGVKMTYQQAESATAFGWLVSETNTRKDQVTAGHLYMKINLIATRLGMALHPMNQIVQEYQDMQTIQKRFKELINLPEGHTVQMLFRLGYAEPVPHTKRRRVGDIVV